MCVNMYLDSHGLIAIVFIISFLLQLPQCCTQLSQNLLHPQGRMGAPRILPIHRLVKHDLFGE